MAMTLCHECGKQISTEAKTCPHCGAPASAVRQKLAEERVKKGLSPSPSPEEQKSGKRAGCLIAAAILVSLWLLGRCAMDSAPKEIPEQAQARVNRESEAAIAAVEAANKPQLELRSFRWSTTGSGRYVEAKGEVKNISGASLNRIQVVVSFYTKDDQLINTETSFLEYQPVLNGQTSPWTVMGVYNPAMYTAKVDFKEFAGGTIPWQDAQKVKK